MIESSYIPEILLRGATVGVLLLGAILLFRKDAIIGAQQLGTLFLLGTAAYVIVSAPVLSSHTGSFFQLLALVATFNSVFFWWFATALFDDNFRWQVWRIIPFVIILAIYLMSRLAPEVLTNSTDNTLHQALVIAMSLHVLWLTLMYRKDDLMELRRRFRLVFVAIIGITVIIIAVVEIVFENKAVPASLTGFHALALFILSLSFLAWILQPNDMFGSPSKQIKLQMLKNIPPEDQIEMRRVETVMKDGIYTQEGFSIKTLSRAVNVPEHRLRRLINQQLGYKNFSAFSNKYRLHDAVTILKDPLQSRRQITQIAFDLGYGSIAPFNRAFKAREGVSPTTFRHTALLQSQSDAS